MLRTLLVLMLVLVSGCGLGSDPDDEQTPSVPGEDLSSELACEEFASIHADFDADFEGYDTPEEAVNSWITGTGGIPNGEWTQHEDGAWILIDNHGETVGRAEVSSFTSNASTTFPTDRYMSGGIEYCE